MPSSRSILVRNGRVVTHKGSFDADVLVDGERIAEIASTLPARSTDRQIDATGLLVLPGGVDPHVHLSRRPSLPPEVLQGDDFLSGSQGALAGGVTTVGEIASPEIDEGVADIVSRVESEVMTKSLVDVFVHPVLGSATRRLDQISKLPASGQPSLKVFLMDPTLSEDPGALRQAVQRAANAGVTVLFHCESWPELAAARAALIQDGKTSLRYLPESRPPSAEARATEQAIDLCHATGATGYIVHISCEQALGLCSNARAQGVPIHTETRPEFLHLTSERHRGANARLHVIIPPLREDVDRDSLWRGLHSGAIDTVATDDAAFWTETQKLAAPDSFDELRMGISGLQILRPMLFSEGVLRHRITLARFVEVTSAAPARIFGLYPQKGTIAVGSDADLVLWDPEETREISASSLFSKTNFSVYEGQRVTGWPCLTIRRGAIVFEDRTVLARAGSGRLISRTRPMHSAKKNAAVRRR